MSINNTARLICGVDEAGRGPLAGPVFAAAVILCPDRPIEGLADSKKLTERARDFLATEIRTHALAWSIAEASVAEIDTLNILGATLLAMRRAVETLNVRPDEVWVDGNRPPKLDLPVKTIVGGDASVCEISAASILAKTARDAEMLRLDVLYPQYGLKRHKGYPTAAHLDAIRSHGITPIHRRSFGPVRAVLAQDTLF